MVLFRLPWAGNKRQSMSMQSIILQVRKDTS